MEPKLGDKAVMLVSGQHIWKRETWLKSHSMKVNFRIYFKISHFEYKLPSPWGKNNYTHAKFLTLRLLTGKRLLGSQGQKTYEGDKRKKGGSSNGQSEAAIT